MAVEIILHQALFGYDSGHHLIAASRQLPSELRHLLAVATDLSGTSPNRGFDSTFTGIPLPNSDYYALFRTWLAPELPRPGCVWSHVILIELADLAEVADLGRLRELFNRPSRNDWDDYEEPIYFKNLALAKGPKYPVDTPRAERLLTALYSSDQPIVFAADEESKYQDLIFSIWSQQWPKLRRNFRFSTGSFADRGRGGTAFDLQITPTANERAWQHGTGIGLQRSFQNQASPENDWVNAAAEDLLRPGQFRQFSRSYGADIEGLRGAFVPLCRMFRFFSVGRSQNWKSVLTAIASQFPEPKDALLLKQYSVDLDSEHARGDVISRTWEIVNFLCTESACGPYSQVAFDFESAASKLWPRESNQISRFLSEFYKEGASERVISFATAVAEQIQPNDFENLWEQHPGMLSLLFYLRPSLANSPLAWQLPERAQWRIIDVLERQSRDALFWREVIAAMLVANTSIAVREIVSAAGLGALKGTFEHFKASGSLPSAFWREALRPIAERHFDSGELELPELVYCFWLLPQSKIRDIPPSRADVQRLARMPLVDLPPALRLPAAFILLTLGFLAKGEAAIPLIANSFFSVHQSLATDTEPPESWRLLKPTISRFPFLPDWDRCASLRSAIQEWASNHSGAREALLNAVRVPSERVFLSRILSGE